MAFIQATAAPVVAIVGDNRIEFPKLTLRDMGQLLANWIADERGALLERLELAGATSAEKLAELNKLHTEAVERGGPSWAMGQLVRPGRIHDTLLKSRRKAKPETTADDIDAIVLNYHQLFELCLSIWGAPRGDNPDEPEPADEAASPKAKPARATTGA